MAKPEPRVRGGEHAEFVGEALRIQRPALAVRRLEGKHVATGEGQEPQQPDL